VHPPLCGLLRANTAHKHLRIWSTLLPSCLQNSLQAQPHQTGPQLP
jgi:hypothetical protein